MHTVRSNLTRIKNTIQEKLPDGEDILGFSGISKAALLDCVDQSYQLSYKLADLEPKFEITVLKRKLAGLIDGCKEYLNKGLDQWDKERKFDSFVSDLTKIKEEIRLTYLVVVDGALRTEAQASQILSDYEQLSSRYKEYESAFQSISASLLESESAHKKILEMQQEAVALSASLEQANTKIDTMQVDAEANYKFTAKYESEAKERTQNITDLAARLSSMEKKSEDLNAFAEQSKLVVERITDELSNQMELNKQQQTEIQNTLENANRAGMAGSFKSRKDELNLPMKVWGAVFVLAVIAIFTVGIIFLAPYVDGKDLNSIQIGIKVFLVSPFVWLAWMSVKQYGYLSRIREDYAYKYASAMAFEGYRKHAIEIDDDLLNRLLTVSIENLSQNPIRLFDATNNHGGPFNEVAKEMKEVISATVKSTLDKVSIDRSEQKVS